MFDGCKAFSKQVVKTAINDGSPGRLTIKPSSAVLAPTQCKCSEMVQAREITRSRELQKVREKILRGI